jgi:murein DD-endopeptidase MepM/ murein hydrolase activator NlpD
MEANKKLQYETGLELDMQKVLMDPTDRETLDSSILDAERRISTRYIGAPQETIDLEVAKAASKLEAAAISLVGDEDPMRAEVLIRNASYLMPQEKTALSKSIGGEVEKYQARGYANEALSKFEGETDAGAGIAWIRETVKDPDIADAAVSKYQQFVREKNIGIKDAEDEQKKIQKENHDKIIMDYANGSQWADDDINGMYERGEITAATAAQTLGWNNATSGYVNAETKLRHRVPNYDQLPQSKKDALLMAESGTTPEIHAEAMRVLNAGIARGLTDAEVKDYANRNLITTAEAERLKAAIKGFDKQNSAALAGIKKNLQETLDPDKTKSILKGMYPEADFDAMMSELDGYIAELSANNDPDIVKKAGVRARLIQARAIQEVFTLDPSRNPDGTRLHDIPYVPQFGFIGEQEPTKYNELVHQAEADLERIIELSGKTAPPTAKVDDIAIPNVEYKDISTDILGGVYPLTSGFDSRRTHGAHNGLDFGAPIGTPVRVPGAAAGGELTVAAVVADQGNSHSGNGNRVVLRGVDANGNQVEWQFNHLSAVDPSLRVGASVSPGAALGKVGNTGTVVASPGGNGAHLDLKLKVNGKAAEPRDYYRLATTQPAQPQQPTQPAQPTQPTTPAQPAQPAGTPGTVAYARETGNWEGVRIFPDDNLTDAERIMWVKAND